MAKGRPSGKAPSTSRPSASRKAANARGFAKRQSLKSKVLGTKVADVYEYSQEKVRRAKVKPLLEKDEAAGMGGRESGSGSDEDEEAGGRQGMRPRLVGENEGDSGIGEDEDEEIDSDAAFEESDEERYAGFSFSHKPKSKTKTQSKRKPQARAVRFAEVDLNEDGADQSSEDDAEMSEVSDEEEEEEGDPSEFIDVLDVLDGRGEPDSGDDTKDAEQQEGGSSRLPVKDKRNTDDAMDSANDEDEDEDEDEESEDEDEDQNFVSASEEDEQEDDSALQDLDNFVSGLDVGQKRKAPDGDDAREGGEAKRARKRRVLPERTEAGVENEFAPALGGGKLNLDDLLAPLQGQSSNLISLKKSAKVLASTSGKIQTLAAPLPQRTAERLDREAAYEQTKGEVDKWKATMQRIQEAEHLSFPLQAQPQTRTSNLELTAKFKPTTELESAVDKLLKSAKLREDEIAHTETLKMNHLSVEEVSARRAELAKMRDLMFRAEAKAKRVAKIKSKTYRRIRKKERARLAEKLGEGDDDDLDDEDAQLKREVERARERATLRHKNTGKWAKAMRERGELDEDQRRDINEMLDRGEKLRRKIQGQGDSDEEEESEDDESDGEEGEERIARIKAKAFDELAALNANEPEGPVGKKGKSIFEMKFMKDAMAREQRKANEMVDDFVREMGGGDPDEEGDIIQGAEQPQNVTITRVGGRVSYRPGALNTGERPVGSLASDTSSVTLKSTDLLMEAPAELSTSPPGSPVSQRAMPPPVAEANPWLAQAGGSGKALQTKHEVAVSKTSGAAEKSKNKLRKSGKKQLEEREKAQEDAAVDISLSTVMTLADAPAKAGESSKSAKSVKPSASVAAKTQTQMRDDDDDDSDVHSELEEQERAALKSKGKGKAMKGFAQRDLVALAFAGDNVVQDFADAKRREMAEDAPKEIDTTLPGWGSWGGRGTKKAPPKPYLIKKLAGIDPKSRADFGKAHVIISEKRDKKAAKYLVKDLPYPYTSRAQYERSLEVPLGTEWNTRLGFQRATLPKVVTKMGTLITPLEKQHS